MIKVILLGYGNVGSHLCNEFIKNRNIEIVQVYNRSIDRINHLKDKVKITDNLTTLLSADIYIISISDDTILKFTKSLKLKDSFIIHTSGSLGLDVIQSTQRKGVFYPLQTFTKDKEIKFKKVPICLESNNNEDLILLEQLASSISDNVFILDSEKRKKMHIAAVFVNNFTNHLYQIGSDICERNEVPFEILLPLIKETAEKVQTLTPLKAQTGPAKRNDQSTISMQINQLKESELSIYKSLTDSIIKTYQ